MLELDRQIRRSWVGIWRSLLSNNQALSDTVTLSEEHIDYRWMTGEEFLALEELAMLTDLVAEVTLS